MRWRRRGAQVGRAPVGRAPVGRAAVGCAAVGRAAVLGLVLLAGCGRGGPPAVSSPAPPVVVPGSPGAFTEVELEAGTRQVSLSSAEVRTIAPLLAAKGFRPVEALPEYGLDPARARLVYRRRRGSATVLLLGGTTFDDHFVYVMKPSGSSIYTVAADQLRPLLALVGVAVPS